MVNWSEIEEEIFEEFRNWELFEANLFERKMMEVLENA
jgi:hypothetical protein